MEEMLCSLCGKRKKAAPLDMDDVVFGSYVRLARSLGISRHKEALGVCRECMPAYSAMQGQHRKKMMVYFTAGLLFAVVYLAITGNILVSLAVALFLSSLSVFSYCPPLGRNRAPVSGRV